MLAQIHDSLSTLAIPITGLTPDPNNARVHTDRNLDAIAASLRAYGQRKPIVVQKDGMIVRAGNGTLDAARRLGWDKIAAVVIDEEDVLAAAYGLADNRTAELASWDEATLARVLGRISTEADDYDPMTMGFEEAEVIGLLAKFDVLGSDLSSLDFEPEPTDPSEQTGTGTPTPTAPSDTPELPPSHVRMVQLFLTEDSHPEFLANVRALAGSYGTSNITDTVLKAVADAAGALS